MKFDIKKNNKSYLTELEYDSAEMSLRTGSISTREYKIAIDNDILKEKPEEFEGLLVSWAKIFEMQRKEISNDMARRRAASAISDAIIQILNRKKPLFGVLRRKYYMEYSSIVFSCSDICNSEEERVILLTDALQLLFEFGNEREVKKRCKEYPGLFKSEKTANELIKWHLGRYDLQSAANVIKESITDSSRLNRFVARMLGYLVVHSGTTITCLIAAFFIWSYYISEMEGSDSLLTESIFFAPYVLICVTFAILAFSLFSQNRHFFSQIFLPRILGAVIFGLIFLAFTESTWKFPLEESSGRLLLTILLLLLSSFLYLYFSISGIEDITGKQVMSRSLSIFALGLLYAFALSTIVVSLLGNQMTSEIEILHSFFCFRRSVHLFSETRITLNFFPSVALLYSSLSLFIGVFLQLFWQEKGISESV